MALYNIADDKLEAIKEQDFKLEKDIQKLTEVNLKSILGYDFVRSEFSLNNFRIDTLAFDKEARCFVIIEYKKDKNFSVIDQGYAYLALMLNNKADFILEYNENCRDALKREQVDWSQSKVIFISPSFTLYQREAINFKDLPIELWEVKKFNNNTISYNKVQTSGSKESVNTISRKDATIEKVSTEIKVYTEQEHIESGSEEIKELYEKYRKAILDLDELEVRPKKYYIGFIGATNVVDIHIQKNSMKLWINLRKGELNDPKNLARDVSQIGHWGNGDYALHINCDEDLEYILSLIKQSLKKNKK